MILNTSDKSVDMNHVYTFNDTAAYLWEQIKDKEDFTIQDLIIALTSEYDVTEDIAKADVTELINIWKEAGFIVK